MIGTGVDPTLQLVARAGLSLLLGWSGAHKLRDVGAFRAALEGYELLPPRWAVPAGAGLIAAEVGIASGLLLPRVAGVAALAAAGLLTLYAAAIAINLVRGRRDIDCGCAGPAGRQPISAGLVARNAALAAVALVGAVPTAARPLTWLDGVTVLAGVAALGLLYAAADGLLANAPRSAALGHVHAFETSPAHEGAHD